MLGKRECSQTANGLCRIRTLQEMVSSCDADLREIRDRFKASSNPTELVQLSQEARSTDHSRTDLEIERNSVVRCRNCTFNNRTIFINQ